ncbi:MAG: DUF3365 domain-containing protein [Gemmatimonadales bacterium]
MADSVAIAAARQAAASLGGDLLGMLTRALQEGGPDRAIAFCADSAQARSARHQAEGVQVRRVGTRVRNPANAPDSVERAVLAAFAASLAGGTPPGDTAFVATGADGAPELRYLRPVLVAEPCLACHGDPAAMSSRVREVLASRYPADEAVGYQVGELRGAVSVRRPVR